MPLTKQGNELVHAVVQGGRDEAKAGCVTADQLRTLYGRSVTRFVSQTPIMLLGQYKRICKVPLQVSRDMLRLLW